jgi:hypothetical protein
MGLNLVYPKDLVECDEEKAIKLGHAFNGHIG